MWTAARAVQRNFCSTKAVHRILESSGFYKSAEEVSFEDYQGWFYSMSNKLLGEMSSEKFCSEFKNPTFGRAAKVVSVYMKTYYLMCDKQVELCVSVIYPPIDDILIKGIIEYVRETSSVDSSVIAELDKIRWTKLDETGYRRLHQLVLSIPLEFNWTLERFWKAYRD